MPSSGDLISRRSIELSAASTSTPLAAAARAESFRSSSACSICRSVFSASSRSRSRSTSVTEPGDCLWAFSAFSQALKATCRALFE